MEVSGQLHNPAASPPRKQPPGTHWIGSWVGPRAGLDMVVKSKIPRPCWDLNPPIIQAIAQHYTSELSQLLHYFIIDIIYVLKASKYMFTCLLAITN
jgi:hypothetical protein